MNRTVIITILFVLIYTHLLRAEELALTSEEAVSIALRDNRDILLKAEEVKKAKYKINESLAGLLPTASVAGTYSQKRELYSKDFTSYTSQAGAKLNLYQGGEVVNTIGYNRQGLGVAEALLDKAKMETVFNVKKTFYTLLLASDFANLNKDMLENTQAHLEAAQARYRKGEAAKEEILKMEASLTSVKQAYDASLNQVESSRLLLNNLLYLDKELKIIPNGAFAYTPEDIAYDEAFLNSMKNRPEIREYESRQEQAKRNIEITRAATRPTIYASWDYYSNSQTSLGVAGVSLGTTKSWNDYNVAGINVSWPIFDGFAAKQKVEQAVVDLKEAKLSREKLSKDITMEVKSAYISFKDAVGKLSALDYDVAVYNDNLATVKEKYRQGIASSLDLNDADLKYGIAVFNRNQGIYDYIVAKTNLDKAQGGIDDF